MTEVYLNSKYIGTVEDPTLFIEDIKDLRRKGTLSINLNVYYDEDAQEILLLADEGRARRPLIIVQNGKSKLTEEHLKKLNKNEISWEDLVKKSVIEYLDAAEEENAFVSLDENIPQKDALVIYCPILLKDDDKAEAALNVLKHSTHGLWVGLNNGKNAALAAIEILNINNKYTFKLEQYRENLKNKVKESDKAIKGEE